MPDFEAIATQRRETILKIGEYVDGVKAVVNAYMDGSGDDCGILALLNLTFHKIYELIDENI